MLADGKKSCFMPGFLMKTCYEGIKKYALNKVIIFLCSYLFSGRFLRLFSVFLHIY